MSHSPEFKSCIACHRHDAVSLVENLGFDRHRRSSPHQLLSCGVIYIFSSRYGCWCCLSPRAVYCFLCWFVVFADGVQDPIIPSYGLPSTRFCSPFLRLQTLASFELGFLSPLRSAVLSALRLPPSHRLSAGRLPSCRPCFASALVRSLQAEGSSLSLRV